MSPEQIIEKIDTILVDEFELESQSVVPGARLREELDLDSLDAVDLVVALERAFGIRVDHKVLDQMLTVGDIHDYVRNNYGTQEQLDAAAKSAEP